MKYEIPKIEYLKLKEMSAALQYGNLKSDKRIQVKMPSAVVTALDAMFSGEDRSKVITKAVLEMLLNSSRMSDSTLEAWQTTQQYDLDRMWTYLDEREDGAS
jgi:hypothetical protein